MPARSYLFVPADRPDRIDKALASGADAVIVDLEDAVAPQAKVHARTALAGWLATASASTVLVRVNAAQTPWWDDDLRLAAHPAVAGVVVPKACGAADLAVARDAVGGRPLLPLVETAAGLDAVDTVARAPGVRRLLFGSVDFQADLGIEGDDDALLAFRSRLVLASRLAGLAAPVDGVTLAVTDADAVLRDTVRARRLGFGAKLCIHPAQVAAVHRGFAPTADELDRARRIVAAADAAGAAALAVDGRMVDAPVVQRARDLLRRTPS